MNSQLHRTDAMKPLKRNFIHLLQLLASPALQDRYQSEVDVDIGDELLCMWFDDFYSSSGRVHVQALLTEEERYAVDKFDAYYDACTDDLPRSYREMRGSDQWRKVVEKANETLQHLEWDQVETVWAFGAV